MCMLTLMSCKDDLAYPDNPEGNFDALAEVVGSKYCFFQEKGIDWDAVTAKYRKKINSETSDVELFFVCAAMLDELKDGHVNLISDFNTSYYRAWWTNYPQDFNLRTLQEYYLKFNYLSTSGMIYKILPDDVGYLYYPSFASGISELSLDYVLAVLGETKGLILDIRDNGGGIVTNIDILVGRFIKNEISGGYITHKTGPGKNEFSEPYYFSYKPAKDGRIQYLDKPIALLTNRSCYSAANAFAAVMKSLPQVKIIGARTGGGGGMPFSSELPNGWSVRFSASPVYGPDGMRLVLGIDP